MKKQIKLGALLGYANLIANALVSLIYTPFMLKAMGQSEYGLYSLVASVIGYLSIMDLGFGNAMVRFVSKSQAKKDNQENKINGLFLFLYCIIAIIVLILGLVILFNVDTIFANSLTIIEIEKSKILVLIMIISLVISFPLTVFDSYIVANERFVYSKIITLAKNLIKPLVMIPLLLFGYKSVAMTLVVAITNVLYHVFMALYSIFKLNIKFEFSIKNIDTKLLKEIAAYSFFIFLNIIVDKVFNSTDQVILGIVCSTSAVAIYSVASTITTMNTQCSTVISGLFLPKITKTLEENNSDEKVSNLFLKVSRLQIYLMMLILFGFITFGKYFINLWAGKDYIDAYYIILVLILPSVVPLTQNLGISVLQAKNMHQFRSVVYISIAVLNVLISIPLAKNYAGVGAAIGSALANLLGQIIIMNIFYYKKAKLDIPTYWKFFAKMFIYFSIESCVFMIINKYININIYSYIFEILIFTFVYAIICYLNTNEYEKSIVDKFLVRLKIKK